MTDPSEPITLFLSYAHEDEVLLQQLIVHLSGLQRQGLIKPWHDRQIFAGTKWTQAIDTHLEQASVILLLVSPDFMASDYCYEIEMTRAFQRHAASEARIIPIILRRCDWSHTLLAQLQVLPLDGKPITEWGNQDMAWDNVTTGIRRVIENLSLLERSATRAALPPIWNIPFPQNSFFIGRDELLARLHTQLQAGHATALSQPQAVSGLGGIGKTQIAVQYAYLYHQEYEAVLWARAENEETLISSYSTIAKLLNLPEQNAQKQDVTIQAVKTWLQTHGNWLLILDNADDLDLLPPFLPPVMGGHLLLTTRAWAMQRLAQRIEVETLPKEQGALFLLRRAGLLTANAPLENALPEERTRAMQLVQEMGGLPLALDQAGAYLDATGMSLEQYQQVYQTHRRTLLQKHTSLISDHPASVATTWSISFENVEKKNPAAVDLLRLCAYLSADAIPEEILTKGASHFDPPLKSIAADPFLLSEAIEVLRAYSLLSRDPRTHTLTVHRLVQAVLRDRMDTEEEKQWKQRAVLAVNAARLNVQDVRAWWDICERWLPHAQVCTSWIVQEQMTFPEATLLLNDTGYYLHDRSQYAEAEVLFMRALAIREQQLGGEHPFIATSLNNLASLYYNQRKYVEAEVLYVRALAIREQQLGGEHPFIATSLNNLASLYNTRGKHVEAEALYIRALAICKQQLGEEHPRTATSLSNLAGLYKDQGRHAEAEVLYIRALAIYEQLEHPFIATSLNNLAGLYYNQRKYAEAEVLYIRALAICEQLKPGEEHPCTATSILNNLAGLYEDQGKHDEAEALYIRALAICEQLKPEEEHPCTATSLNNLASLYNKRGKYAEAEVLFMRALAIYDQQLGGEHRDAVTSLSNLASLYENQGKPVEAEALYVRALAICEQQLGGEHIDAAASLNNLASLYYRQKKYAEAEVLYMRALAIREQQLGEEHPNTATSLNNLAELYRDQGKDAEAEPLYVRALAIYEQQLGGEHPNTATILNNLALLYKSQGKDAEAEPLYERALAIYKRLLGTDHPWTQTARENYARLLRTMGRDEDARRVEGS